MTGNKQKPPFYLIDTTHPFYKPLWIRIAIVLVTVLWAFLEITSGNTFLLVISVALAIYCTWVLLFTYTAPEPTPVRPPDPEEDDEVVTDEKKD